MPSPDLVSASQIISGHTALSIAATIDRLKSIAADAMDRLYLSDGPPHPDHILLDAAADALRIMREEKDLRKSSHELFDCSGFAQLPEAEQERRRVVWRENQDELTKLSGAFRTAMFVVRKRRATTPAGIFAKALICRQSTSGAAMVAMSLAEDLVNTPNLRASIWPSEGAGA